MLVGSEAELEARLEAGQVRLVGVEVVARAATDKRGRVLSVDGDECGRRGVGWGYGLAV